MHSQGQQVASEAKKQKQDDAAARLGQAFAAARSGRPLPPPSSSSSSQGPYASPASALSTLTVCWPERRVAWVKTGVVGLRGLGLEELPEDAFGGAPPHEAPKAAEEAAVAAEEAATGLSEAVAAAPPPLFSPSPPPAAPAVPPAKPPPSPPLLLALARAADLSHNRLGRLPPTLLSQVTTCMSTLYPLPVL